ncbi:MAG TPA: kelch repeat-containing protein [Planctomycetota bacterium]|nr:kelch repeat-containing protein [Planctomycetota bacterium]
MTSTLPPRQRRTLASWPWQIATPALVVSLFAAPTPAQGYPWLHVAGSTAPSVRRDLAMAYDSIRQRIVLFGGSDGQTFGDTWLRSAAGWLQQSPATSPSARRHHTMAYDAARQRVILFGGVDAGLSQLGDTWEWDGSTWTQRLPATSPQAREGHAMAYDAANQRVVLFGGLGAGQLGDTWTWNGSNWSLASPAASPVARFDHAMAYDPVRQRVVMFGGKSAALGNLGDTWEWNGSSWLAAFSATFPSARSGHAMTYDATSGFTLLFGGRDSQNLSDTWRWNGSNWSQLLPASVPCPRQGHGMASDGNGVVMFGGENGGNLGDTWISNPGALTYGIGCGAPPLGLQPDPAAPPSLGQVARATIVDAPTLLAAVSLGASRDFFGPFPLPVTLASIGMPGCDLLQSAELVGLSASPLTATTLSVPLQIPNQLGLVGAHLYLQAYALAPGQNPLQVVVSNGLDWTIGCPLGTAQQLVEDFNDALQLDVGASAGSWTGGFGYFGSIGGDGRHGAFDISLAVDTGQIVGGKRVYELDCDHTIVPAANTTTGTALTVTDGRFFFSSMALASNQRLRFTGSSAPVITVSGTLEILGDIEVLGGSNETVPSSIQLAGQAGASGGIGGGRGGNGGDRCLGVGPGVGNPFDGRNGEGARLVAGHAYAASAVGTGGRGSVLYPASGLAADLQFGASPPFPGIYYCLSAAAGGGGGGLSAPGQIGRVLGVYSGTTPLPNQSTFMGPMAPGGTAVQLFPFPAVGTQRSSLHFLVGGAGGGGSASNSTFSLNLVPASAWAPGAGGGGGGGAMALRAGGLLVLSPTGSLLARGGNAADNLGIGGVPQVAPAGGGSGGSIVLQSGGLAGLFGPIDVNGGRGGFFRKTGGSGIGPNGGIIEIQGGNGGPGFVRLETPLSPTVAALATMTPPATANNVGPLNEVDDLVAMRSKFYATGLGCVGEFLRYEIHASVGGTPFVFSDDPTVSTMQAIAGAPLRARFQAGNIDLVTGEVLGTGPWREAVGNQPGRIGIAADGGNGYRFQLVIDRAVASSVIVDQVVVVYR